MNVKLNQTDILEAEMLMVQIISELITQTLKIITSFEAIQNKTMERKTNNINLIPKRTRKTIIGICPMKMVKSANIYLHFFFIGISKTNQPTIKSITLKHKSKLWRKESLNCKINLP